MASVAKSAFNPVSVATNGCLLSSSSLLAPSKISFSYTNKPTKFQLYCKPITSLSLTSLSSSKKKETLFRVCVVAAQGEVEEDEQEFQGKLDWGAAEVEEEGSGAEGGYVEPPEGAKVYVGNLPYNVSNEALAELFEQAGVVEIAEVVYDRMTGQSRGFGFVTMSTVEEAERAVELFSRYDMGGRFLTVNIAAPKGSRPERAPREAGNRIYVGNISWNADESQLEQMFSQYGTVVSARIVYDKETGRSRGFGFVEMSSPSEMNDAISNLDGEDMDGRAIRVNAAEERTKRGRF